MKTTTTKAPKVALCKNVPRHWEKGRGNLPTMLKEVDV